TIVVNKSLPSLPVKAGDDTIIHISPYFPPMKEGSEYLADIHFDLKRDELWAPKGYEVASNQFALTGVARGKAGNGSTAGTTIKEVPDGYIVAGKGFTVKFGKTDGGLQSYVYNGKEQILQPFLPHFTRPLTDNDRRGWKPNRKLFQWYQPKMRLKNISTANNGSATVVSSYTGIHDS